VSGLKEKEPNGLEEVVVLKMEQKMYSEEIEI